MILTWKRRNADVLNWFQQPCDSSHFLPPAPPTIIIIFFFFSFLFSFAISSYSRYNNSLSARAGPVQFVSFAAVSGDAHRWCCASGQSISFAYDERERKKEELSLVRGHGCLWSPVGIPSLLCWDVSISLYFFNKPTKKLMKF